MQAIAGLGKDDAMRTINNFRGLFHCSVRRKTVHECHIFFRSV